MTKVEFDRQIAEKKKELITTQQYEVLKLLAGKSPRLVVNISSNLGHTPDWIMKRVEELNKLCLCRTKLKYGVSPATGYSTTTADNPFVFITGAGVQLVEMLG